MCFSCGFLVSVLWMVFVPLLVSFFIPFFGPFLVSSFVPFFAPLRLSFRPSARFPRFVPRFALRSALLFVSPFGRVGWAVCWSRRFCQLVWGGRAFISLSCFGAVGAMYRHVVSLMGGGSEDGVAGRLCGA